MNLKKRLLLYTSILYLLLSGCKSEDKRFDDSNGFDSKIVSEQTYQGNDVGIFNVYDSINDEKKSYFLEEYGSFNYGPYLEGDCTLEVKEVFSKVLSSDVIEESKITGSEKKYIRLLDNAYISIKSYFLDNRKLDIKAMYSYVFVIDYDKNLIGARMYWSVNEEGNIINYFSSINDDLIVISKNKLANGVYSEGQLEMIQDAFNSCYDNPILCKSLN